MKSIKQAATKSVAQEIYDLDAENARLDREVAKLNAAESGSILDLPKQRSASANATGGRSEKKKVDIVEGSESGEESGAVAPLAVGGANYGAVTSVSSAGKTRTQVPVPFNNNGARPKTAPGKWKKGRPLSGSSANGTAV